MWRGARVTLALGLELLAVLIDRRFEVGNADPSDPVAEHLHPRSEKSTCRLVVKVQSS